MKLYVWGVGCGAGELADQGLRPEDVTAFVDSVRHGAEFLGRPVLTPEELKDREIDLILVSSRQTEAIAARARALAIDEKKLLFTRANWTLSDRNRDYGAAEGVLNAAFLESLRRPQHAVRDPLWVTDSPLEEKDLENDYVRARTLEALCARLNGVVGAAAELGVYRGGFARCLNALLPERTLYLFDTFSGFDEAEAPASAPGLVAAHRLTGSEQVLRLMPHPGRVVLMPGLFPESLRGLDERFCLVSLDVDLEESTLAGLRYFIPRLAPGGYLLLHDWNNPRLPGVRRALERYEAERGERVRAVPLCDINGSLVLCG